jgi:hypothetical protein
MNRHQRRSRQKLSRDASPDEIMPGTHGPVQSGIVELMRTVVDVLREEIGTNYDVTLFVAERNPPDGADRLPRFNYMSTACQEDMIAVLDAFVIKHREAAPKIDRINDEPPSEAKQ